MEFKPIGFIRHKYSDEEVREKKDGVDAIIEILPEYEIGLTGIDGFSHIIIISYLHKAYEPKLLIKPKRLLRFGVKMEELPEIGVFSSDAPSRPNPIGVSVVKLKFRRGRELYVENCDLFNDTPVLDIKPLTLDKLPNEVSFPDWYERLIRIVRERSGQYLKTI
jgi:tRNA-Thr(GGU) m(6)t(6)A37 methyltransferase TsaA